MAATNFENAELNLVIIDKDGIAQAAFLRQKDTPVPTGGGNLSVVDLGLISLRDALANGRTVPLIAAAEGRVIKSVRFLPGGTSSYNLSDWPYDFWFLTPNSWQDGNANFRCLAYYNDNNQVDTLGIIVQGNQASIDGGNNNSYSQIVDAGPLILGVGAGFSSLSVGAPAGAWQAIHAYGQADKIIDPNGHLQVVSTNGISDSTIPDFDDEGGFTPDGTVNWYDAGEVPDQTVRAIAEIIEGVDPTPLYPATIEFVQQPTNTEAEATITPAVTVIVKDQNGDPYTFAKQTISLDIVGAGTLLGTTAVQSDPVFDGNTGIATFDSLSIPEAGTGYIIRALMVPLTVADPILSDPFDITAP